MGKKHASQYANFGSLQNVRPTVMGRMSHRGRTYVPLQWDVIICRSKNLGLLYETA